jgi:hypothetical protein
MSGGAYESDLLNLREQAMRNRSLASHRLFRMPTFLPKIDESTRPRERAVVGGQEARAGALADDAKQAVHRLHRNAVGMYPASRYAGQHSGRFSVVALLARLWRPF